MSTTDPAVRSFIDAVASPTRRRDAETLLKLFERVTGEPARMWEPTIICFGRCHYKYAKGAKATPGRPDSRPERRPPRSTSPTESAHTRTAWNAWVSTVDNEVEAGTERVCHHIRRPMAGRLRVSRFGPLRHQGLIDPLVSQHRGLLPTRSRLVLSQHTSTVFRRVGPADRPRNRVNTRGWQS